MEKRPLRTCVKCGAALKYTEIISAGPFPCPACHTLLQVPDSYRQSAFWGSVIFETLLLAALGFRGLYLFCAVLAAFVPVLYLEVNFLKYLIPPKIETYLPKDTTLRLGD
jgi:predicted RNA-binding Zn-ribbon protein involved in translation (DUF1610 family)